MSEKRIAQVRFFTYHVKLDHGEDEIEKIDVIFDDGSIITVDRWYYEFAKRSGISLIELLKGDGKI